MSGEKFSMPFHDGRSFALYLKGLARDRGLSMYRMFELGVIDSSNFYRYLSNAREPKLSTVYAIMGRLALSLSA